MQAFDLTDPAEGTMAVQLGGDKTLTIDVYAVQNRIHQLSLDLKDRPTFEWHEAVVKLMTDLGMPRCTHRVADKFVKAVAEEAKRLEGFTESATGSGAESPASTASPPSD